MYLMNCVHSVAAVAVKEKKRSLLMRESSRRELIFPLAWLVACVENGVEMV